jgi:hypothetical protein
MSTIVAGHFQLQDQVEQARNELMRAGFPEERISAFYFNQPGQHDLTAIGGDRVLSPGAKESPIGVAEGAAAGGAVGIAVGAAAALVTGPAGPIIGGLVGAHVGSLYSLSKMKEAGEGERGGDGANTYEPRKAGMVVAVAFDQPEQEQRALEVLHRLGSDHIERAHGTIEDGDWTDFNPLSLPELIH